MVRYIVEELVVLGKVEVLVRDRVGGIGGEAHGLFDAAVGDVDGLKRPRRTRLARRCLARRRLVLGGFVGGDGVVGGGGRRRAVAEGLGSSVGGRVAGGGSA